MRNWSIKFSSLTIPANTSSVDLLMKSHWVTAAKWSRTSSSITRHCIGTKWSNFRTTHCHSKFVRCLREHACVWLCVLCVRALCVRVRVCMQRYAITYKPIYKHMFHHSPSLRGSSAEGTAPGAALVEAFSSDSRSSTCGASIAKKEIRWKKKCADESERAGVVKMAVVVILHIRTTVRQW
jgi:hypothetical protein